MNISRDYKDMIEDKYINNKGIFTLEINKLQNELKEPIDVENTLCIMDNLGCYKKVLGMTIGFQNIKNKKNPDKVYVQARGAITVGKGRFWISHYTGKGNGVTDKMLEQAKIDVMKKAIKILLK
jgi:hypothetical protein